MVFSELLYVCVYVCGILDIMQIWTKCKIALHSYMVCIDGN